MNTSQSIMTGAFALSLVAVIGAGSVFAFQGEHGQGYGQGRGQGFGQGRYSSENSVALTDAEKTMLIYGQQEERLARDVYEALGEKYELETFEKISGAENRHMESIGRILERNNIPQTTGYGDLQETFDTLIEKGNISLEDAIEVGIAVEILDIKDLDESLEKTENEQIIRVYEKLREGSINHLNSYVAQLQSHGYSTDLDWEQYISQDSVNEKLECLKLSPEEREAKHASRGERGEREYFSSKGDKVRGRGNGRGNEMRNTGEAEQQDLRVKKGKKAKNFQKFSGELKAKKHFKDGSKIKHKKAVEFLQERGILDGYADGSFQPENTINRAEAIKILLESLGQKPSSGELGRDFGDVKADDWFAGYVKKAKEQRIVKGYQDGTFRPAQTVNQAELLKIAFESFGIDLSDYAVTTLPNGANKDAWYAKYLQYAVDYDLLDDEDVNPNKGMTRDEFSELMYRLILQQEAL